MWVLGCDIDQKVEQLGNGWMHVLMSYGFVALICSLTARGHHVGAFLVSCP
jgi:hypothetical protein